MPVVGLLNDSKQVLVRLGSEDDFVKVMSRESREINSHHFRLSR